MLHSPERSIRVQAPRQTVRDVVARAKAVAFLATVGKAASGAIRQL